MKSKWKVTSNPIGDKLMYAVYRIRDTSKPVHSGNMELATGYMGDRAEAEAIADKLNAEEEEEM